MKTNTYLNSRGETIARGTISELLIDLVLNDGTRYYSTRSDNYSTLNLIKSLDIVGKTND